MVKIHFKFGQPTATQEREVALTLLLGKINMKDYPIIFIK